jgi:hypothetical protein
MTFVPSRVEQALARLDAINDASARELARDAIAALLDYHAEGLRRLSERLRDAGEDGDRLLQIAVDDQVVASLLLLHGVHPSSVAARVRRAFGDVLASRGGDGGAVEVLSISDAAIRLRVTGTESLRRAVARAVEEAAPDVEHVEVFSTATSDFVPLARLTGKRDARQDRCELCAQAIAAEHEHLFDLDRRKPKCACTSCSILLDTSASRIRRIRRVARRLEGFRISDREWTALEVPVGLAFFSYSSTVGGVIAAYPGPAGATESMVPRPAWRAIVAQNPVLGGLEPDTMALLVDRLTATPSFHIVSIDECYRLTGLVRCRWQGITGGDGPTRAIAEFFDGMREAQP